MRSEKSLGAGSAVIGLLVAFGAGMGVMKVVDMRVTASADAKAMKPDPAAAASAGQAGGLAPAGEAGGGVRVDL